MEDGTVSIFGLIFGVAATTTSNVAILIAGASGAAAAAVAMSAGAYLDAATRRDAMIASHHSLADIPHPIEAAMWMLAADFFSASVPILPFIFWPIPMARLIAAMATITLLIILGVGRAWIGKRSLIRTVTETVAIGIAAAMAGVVVGVFINHVTG